jgi:putative aldouronate transport system permease protein
MTSSTAISPATATRSGNVPASRSAAPPLRQRFVQGWRQWWPYYLMMAPGLIFFVIWHYVPIWEAKMAFEQVRIIPPNIWVGLKNFQLLFASPVFWQVLANTVIISGMKLLFVFPVPIVVALLLNEVRSGPFRQFVQSAIYLPHFLSWVVIAAVFIAFLSPTDGAVNQLTGYVGIPPINFMTNTNWIRWVLVLSENWRSAGWDSLLYLAAIIAIDPALYDAAELDGANRWQKILYVTIPGIVPTIATLFILNMGLFMSAGLDQVINLQNDVNSSTIDIVDSYVYRIGLITGEYSLATAAGLFKALIGMVLVLLSHVVSKRLTGKGVW